MSSDLEEQAEHQEEQGTWSSEHEEEGVTGARGGGPLGGASHHVVGSGGQGEHRKEHAGHAVDRARGEGDHREEQGQHRAKQEQAV
jgi:hypothetical protein